MACKFVKLSTLVEIKTGAPMSRAKKIEKSSETSQARVLIPGAMSNGRIDKSQIVVETVSKVKEDLYTKEGDVVVKASTPYDCVYIDKRSEGLLVTSFGLILRPLPEVPVDMRYLAIFFGLDQTNKELQSMSKGMTIQLIKKRDLADFMVPFPPQSERDRLSLLFESTQQVKELCRAIAQKSDLLLQSEFARVALSDE